MYNVKAAVSRLEFGPKPREMEVTDIATGHFVFSPLEGEEVSFERLDEAIVDAGYEIENAAVTVAGKVTGERHLELPNGQLFHVTGPEGEGERPLAGLEPGAEVIVRGPWKAVEGVEVVVAAEVRSSGGESDEPGTP